MGRSLAWLVIDSPDANSVAAELGVKRTGKSGAISDYPLALCALPGDRVMVVSNNCDEPLFAGKCLAALSRRGRIVVASMEEHVMVSSCAEFRNGRKTWSVTHNPENGQRHMAVIGKVPKDFEALKRTAFEMQDREDSANPGVDHVFDLPLTLARVQTGLDVEDNFGLAPDAFQELDLGIWKRAWRATFWWRILIGFFGGLYFVGWIFRKLGGQ